MPQREGNRNLGNGIIMSTKTNKILIDNWVKCPSVGRERKFFYYSKNRNRHIIQNWDTDKWHLSENGRNSIESFDTPEQVMEFAKRNVVH